MFVFFMLLLFSTSSAAPLFLAASCTDKLFILRGEMTEPKSIKALNRVLVIELS